MTKNGHIVILKEHYFKYNYANIEQGIEEIFCDEVHNSVKMLNFTEVC